MQIVLKLGRRLLTSLLLWPLWVSAALNPIAEVEGITEYRLPNGLQVLLAPDESKPTTTVNLTYRVGSRHESYGETGMAHLLEHLLFKGSARHPLVWGEFNKRGLSANGSTWYDRTNYYASFAANTDNLKWYLDWLADSMTNSFIAKKDLVTEMTVVRNEWEMGENNAAGVLLDKVAASHYQWHNYGKTTIGARADVENVDIDRLQAFYKLYYQPDNATLIVTGKFQAIEVLSWVEAFFAPIAKPQRSLPPLYTLEPVQDGERQVTLRRSGGAPQVMAMYHVPPGSHPDHAAMEMLALIMGDTPSGRLHKRLTEANLASATWAWAAALHDPGFAVFGASLAPGQNTTTASVTLLATLETAAAQTITAEELERARSKYIKAWDQQFANSEQVGVALSESVALGDWRFYFLIRDRVKSVRLADVQRVAQERLLPANRTLGLYLPTGQPQRAPAPAFVDVAQEMKTFVPGKALAQVPVFDVSPTNIDASTERGRLAVAGATSGAGLSYALLPKPTRGESVQAKLVLRGGKAASFNGQADVAALMAALLDKGSDQLSRQQVSDRLDALKTQVAFAYAPGEPGALQVSISSKRDHVVAALELVAGLLRAPAFDAAVVEELKRQAQTDIEAQRHEPEAILEEALFRRLQPFERGDIRHVRSTEERLADVKAVTAAELRALHQQVVGSSDVELAVVGDFDAQAVKSAAQAAFGSWPTPVPYERVAFPSVPPQPGRLIFKTPDKQNAVLMVALPLSLNEDDADVPALTMATYLFGNGGQSRLWNRIREREGLSYNVYAASSWSAVDRHSWWMGGAIFAPGNHAKVEVAFREELERALSHGFTAQELEQGKSGLLNFRALARAQDAHLATAWARHLRMGRSFLRTAQMDQDIRALSLEQVNAAFRRHVVPSRLLWGLAGDFKD